MRVFIASLLAAIALFFSGFFWWALLMGIVRPAEVITDQALVANMASSVKESGLYMYPDYGQTEGDATGPMAMLFYEKQMPPMGTMMGMGFVHMFVSALLVSVFVSLSPFQTFKSRFAAVFFLGLFVAVWADAGNMIWWRHPPMWAAFHFGYDVFSWLVAGIIIAGIVRPNCCGSENGKA